MIDRFRGVWGNLAGKLGLGFCLAGFLAIFLGWNGAASYDRVPAQFPWLISGGVTGLALTVIGASLIVVENNRRDRAALKASLDEIRVLLEHAPAASSSNGFAAPTVATPALAADAVIAGSSSYHSPTCRLVADRPDLDVITRDEAQNRDLTPCRICSPHLDAGRRAAPKSATGGRPRRAERR
ncbi:MAG TPA: hypothetical protein VMY88_02150 [Acidimicrobiales bacterium]|nr:hypothetical protein [Acidimicrobiales bacterium]